MADLGFFSRRGANSQSGGTNLGFCKFLPKAAWKWNNFDGGGGILGAPLPWIFQWYPYLGMKTCFLMPPVMHAVEEFLFSFNLFWMFTSNLKHFVRSSVSYCSDPEHFTCSITDIFTIGSLDNFLSCRRTRPSIPHIRVYNRDIWHIFFAASPKLIVKWGMWYTEGNQKILIRYR